jgi:hypothetical protein
MHPPSGIRDDQARTLGADSFYGVPEHGGRIRSLMLGDHPGYSRVGHGF